MADAVFRSRAVVGADGRARPARVEVRGGRIAGVHAWDDGPPVTVELDALVLMPGGIDAHVHVNDPGRSDWEGFASATAAAAAGGVTTIVDMPLNSVPATTTVAGLRAKVAAMAGAIRVDVGLWGGVVPGNAAELAPLARAGVCGFKCFLSPSGVEEFEHVSAADLEVAMPVVAALDRPLLAHAEDPAALAPLPASTRRYADWLASRPPAAEVAAIETLAAASAASGARVHVVHVASFEALAAVERAPHEHPGARLTCETCPHYLTFAAGEIPDGATAFKCAPPIRDAREREGLRAALAAGRFDLVASDHSPAPPSLKHLEDGDFALAWGGIASLELLWPATWSALHAVGGRVEQLATLLAAAPAKLGGLDARKGSITAGLDADLVAFDPDATWTVDARALHHRHTVTPYDGRTLRGRVVATWLRGERLDAGAPALGRWQRRGLDAVDPARAFA